MVLAFCGRGVANELTVLQNCESSNDERNQLIF
jgi:hypothetical protein